MKSQTINSNFRWLAYASVLFTFTLVILGGIVRLTGSGMGCPDWPLCYGQIIPPSEFHTNIEFAHRVVAFLVGLVGISMLVIVWLRYRAESLLKRLLLFGAGVYLFQAALGGVTVLTQNAPWIVSLHLITAMFLFATMLIIAIVVFIPRTENRQAFNDPRIEFTRKAVVNLVGVFILIVSGSIVFASGSSGACGSWPLCDNNLIPANAQSVQWIHMAHRLIAALIGLYLIMTGLRAQKFERVTGRMGQWALWLFVAQVLVGGANVLFGFPLLLNALHLALAAAVWGAAVVLWASAQIESGTGWLGAPTR